MSRFEEFIAHEREVEDIRKMIGCDHLIYQNLDDMLNAAKSEAPNITKFCDACFSGCYPVGDIHKEDFDNLAADRDRGDLPFWKGVSGKT
jgi:amidophosphoribosyltransferase